MKEISLRLKSARELSMGIASFKSNRGLCQAELVALNCSSRELNSSARIPNCSCFIFQKCPSASKAPTVFSALCNPSATMTSNAGLISGSWWHLNACTVEFEKDVSALRVSGENSKESEAESSNKDHAWICRPLEHLTFII